MHPILYSFASISIHTYGVFMALGFALAVLWSIRESKKAKLDSTLVPDLSFIILVGSLLGARLLYVLLKLPYFLKYPLHIFMFWEGGMVFSGGLAGGFLLGFWIIRHKQQSFLQWLDCAVPGVALGQAIGRIGCFMAGCCYGKPCELPWSVTFTQQKSVAPLGIALHPTQLYHSILSFLLFLILVAIGQKLPRQGQRAGVFLLLFCFNRFLVEFYRADFRGAFGPLSVTHISTACFGIFGLWLLFFNNPLRSS